MTERVGQARLPILLVGGRAQCRNGEMSALVCGSGEEPAEIEVTVEWDPEQDLMAITVEYL